MQLTDADITKFRLLYKKYFREEISKEEAYQKGMRLIRLMQIIIKNSKNDRPKQNRRDN